MQSLTEQIPEPSNAFMSELASGLYPADEVPSRFGYSDTQLRTLLNQGWFKAKLREAKSVWSSNNNAPERVRIKAAMAAEETLLDIVRIVQNEDVPPAPRISAHQHIARLGGVETTATQQEGSAAFRVVINLPTGNIQAEAPKVVEGETLDES